MEENITPHIPVWDRSKRDDGTLFRQDFANDKVGDHYVCPAGKILRSTGKAYDGKTIIYRASKLYCDRCSLKLSCCPNVPFRKIPRDINEDAGDLARALMPGWIG